MRKIILLATLIIGLVSCNKPQDQCGEVTDMGTDNHLNYLIKIDGQEHIVDMNTWLDTKIGDYTCVSYD